MANELMPSVASYSQYQNQDQYTIVTKGTLDNVLKQGGVSYDDTEIRGEVSRLSESISSDLDMTNMLKDGKYIPLGNKAIGTVVDITTFTTSSNFDGAVFACKRGDKYKIIGHGGSTPRLYGFLDNDRKILSVSKQDLSIDSYTTIECPSDGYVVFSMAKNSRRSILKINGASRLDDIENSISDIKNEIKSNHRIFGDGISCSYNVENIPAFITPQDGSRLSYFYGLYDELAERFPNYITKVDCDAEMRSSGIAVPSYMNGYPIYMYKFVPIYAPSYAPNESEKETLAVRNKVLITTGTHPEYTSMFGLYNTMKIICEKWKDDENLMALRKDAEFYIIPCASPYGVQHGHRTNYNHVDPNRNMPTKDWESGTQGTQTYGGVSAGSEYESKVLMHYLDEINPAIYIDHHNFNSGTSYSMYVTSRDDICVSIGTHYISKFSSRQGILHDDVFGENDPMLGWCKITTDKGTRVAYACEKGIHGFTVESCDRIGWQNGVFSQDTYQIDTSLVETVATDCILNFLLCALHKICND